MAAGDDSLHLGAAAVTGLLVLLTYIGAEPTPGNHVSNYG
jgi:hypothetical protein